MSLLLAAVSGDTQPDSLAILFVHLPQNDVMLLFRALHINCIVTGCHCCSMQTECESAFSSLHFRNGLESIVCTSAEPHNNPQPAWHWCCYFQILNLTYPKSKSPEKRQGNLQGMKFIETHPTLRLLERSIYEQEILCLLYIL